MIDVTISPARFIQQRGVVSRIGEFIKNFGEKPLFLADKLVASIIKNDVEKSLEKENIPFALVIFKGECCQEEIDRIIKITEDGKYDVLIGSGGGKAIDTAKAAAYYTKVPFISFPTSAATCAAWSSICPVYSEKGEYIGTRELKKNPDLALVDPEIIARAPARLMAAGMGDSLAKWYEGRLNPLVEGSIRAEIALNLSSYLCDLIEKFGPQAISDVKENICSFEVERIIQANILVTGLVGGLGGKKVRSVVAHAFNYALSGMPKASSLLHGERVAIGVLIQLVLEGKKKEELMDLIHFYRMIDLPCSMEEKGVYLDVEEIRKVSFKVCSDPRINSFPFAVDAAMFKDAFFEINNLVKSYQKRREFNDPVRTCKKR